MVPATILGQHKVTESPDLIAMNHDHMTDAQFNDIGSQFPLPSVLITSIPATKEDPTGHLKRTNRSKTSDSLDSGYHSETHRSLINKLRSNLMPHTIPDSSLSEVVEEVLTSSSHGHRLKRLCSHQTGHRLFKKISQGEHWKCLVPACPKADKTWSRKDSFSSHVSRIHGSQILPWCIEESKKWCTGQTPSSTNFDQSEKVMPLNSSQFMEHCTSIKNPTKDLEQPRKYRSTDNVDTLQAQLEPLNVGISKDHNELLSGTDLPYQPFAAPRQTEDSHADADSFYTSGDQSLTASTIDIGLSTQVLAICEEIGLATANHAKFMLSNNPDMFRRCGISETTNTAGSSQSDIGRRASTNTSSSGGSGRRRKEDDNIEENNNHGQGANRPVTHPGSRIPRKTLACIYNNADPRHYSKDNPDEDDSKSYRHCPVVLLRDIAALRQHCKRTHRRPDFYCYRCYDKFKNEPEAQAHGGNEPGCKSKPPKYNDRMTKGQEQDMYATTGTNEQETYRRIFRILLPSFREPESIYQSAGNEDLIRFGLDLFRSISPRECLEIINRRCQLGQHIPISEGQSREVIEEIFQSYFEELCPSLQQAVEGRLQMELWLAQTQGTSNDDVNLSIAQSIPQERLQGPIPQHGQSSAPITYFPNSYGQLGQNLGHENPTFRQNDSRAFVATRGEFHEQNHGMNLGEQQALQYWEARMRDMANFDPLNNNGEYCI